MIRENEHRRMRWASRRGMLELDLVLAPFVDQVFPDLSEEDQLCYRRLMECEDQQLFGWFLGRDIPEDPGLARIVDRILACNAAGYTAG
ncbi:succinate dehydrogenase assembly factor 2 [Chromatocurvus halotolerans]|nr:succinate dehydrogenase assembly factor 2 [Chromatocurvus halotolerans]